MSARSHNFMLLEDLVLGYGFRIGSILNMFPLLQSHLDSALTCVKAHGTSATATMCDRLFQHKSQIQSWKHFMSHKTRAGFAQS